MSADADIDGEEPIAKTENFEDLIETLTKDVQDLHHFKDMFFENHPIEMAIEKNNMTMAKRDIIGAKFDAVEEALIPSHLRAKFLYLKGRLYNIMPTYDPKALESLSKAVKLDPSFIDAWNELGECYWKNFNLKEARICFEGALNQKRHRITLRSLSILLRQETSNYAVSADSVMRSVELAKEAVAMDPKDGQSWSVLGNAYLCQFFLVAQNPSVLKVCLGAYKQAWHDPIAKGHPDLHYNKAMALKYDELYPAAIDSFVMALRLDPPWGPPAHELLQLVEYLNLIDDLLKTKGKIKAKRLAVMVKSMQQSMFGDYQPGTVYNLSDHSVTIQHVKLGELVDGENIGKVVLGRVIGSIHTNNSVPFTFGILDDSMNCTAVTVYNWADGRGVIIGDCVAILEPKVATHKNNIPYPEAIANKVKFLGSKSKDNVNKKTHLVYAYRSIRVNDPTTLRVNGKKIGRDEFASTRVTSTYEAY